MWTVLFVIVNQVAYTVVVRLASSGTAQRASTCSAGQRGQGHRLHGLLADVPDRDGAARDHHGLAGHRDAAAALVPGRRRATCAGLGRSLARVLRTALARGGAVRAAAAGDRAATWPRSVALRRRRRRPTASTSRRSRCSARAWCSSPCHYLVLRGFYALERTRTVFFIQCAVAATNIVAAVVLVARTDAEAHRAGAGRWPTPRRTPSARSLSYLVLRPRLLEGRRPEHPGPGALPGPARHRDRRSPRASRSALVPAAPRRRGPEPPGAPWSGSWSSGGADVLVFLALTRVLRLTEVTTVHRHGHAAVATAHPDAGDPPTMSEARTVPGPARGP